MAKNVLADLVLRLSANSAELEKGLAKANGTLDKLGKNTTNIGGQIVGSLAKAGAIFASVSGSLKFLKTSIESVEGPGDRFAAIMAGGSEALGTLQRAIGSLDFSNLIKNLIDSYNRGKDLEDQLDALADSNAYTRYLTAQLEVQSRELQATIKNTNLSLAVREEAARKRQEIEKQIKDITIAEAEKTFQLEKQSWEGRNKMSVDQAIQLYANIRKLSAEELAALQEDYNKRNELGLKWSDGAVAIAAKVAKKIAKTSKDAQDEILENTEEGLQIFSSGENMAKAMALPPSVYNDYNKFFRLLDKGERDVIIKLFDSQTKYLNVTANAQERLNTSIRESAGLIVKLGKEGDGEVYNQYKTNLEAYNRTLGKTQNILGSFELKIPEPDFSIFENAGVFERFFTGLAVKPEVISTWDQLIVRFKESGDIINVLSSAINGLEGVFTSLFSGAEGGLKGLTSAVLDSVKMIINAYLAEAIAATIAKNAKLPFGLITAAVGVAALTAFWKTKVPEFASGGIAYGPTMGMIGEYPGARSNPEVIAPLSDLRDILGGGGPGEVRFVIEQNQLVGILEQANLKNIYF